MAAPLEYTPEGSQDIWKVEKFEWLTNEFNVRPSQIVEFHSIASAIPKSWQIIRLIYGINPLVMPIDCDADYMRVMSRFEICVKLQMNDGEVQGNLDVALASWRKLAKPYDASKDAPAAIAPPPPPIPEPEQPKPKKPIVTIPSPPPRPPVKPVTRNGRKIKGDENGEYEKPPIILPALDNEGHGALLLKYGFNDGTFGNCDRDINEAIAEREWFIWRLIDLQKIFDEPAVSSQARQALLSEVQMRRVDAKMLLQEVDSKRFAQLQDVKTSIEGRFQKAWDQITSIMPWAAQIGNKVNFAGTISDLMVAVREFVSKGDNKLIDGLRTALEIQIEMRESVQHEIRYRPGQTAAIHEAVGGLWDPDWKRKIPDRVCKMLDEGLREGAKRVREQANIELPDIEADGPSGEYPPLFVAPEEPTEDVMIQA